MVLDIDLIDAVIVTEPSLRLETYRRPSICRKPSTQLALPRIPCLNQVCSNVCWLLIRLFCVWHICECATLRLVVSFFPLVFFICSFVLLFTDADPCTNIIRPYHRHRLLRSARPSGTVESGVQSGGDHLPGAGNAYHRWTFQFHSALVDAVIRMSSNSFHIYIFSSIFTVVN